MGNELPILWVGIVDSRSPIRPRTGLAEMTERCFTQENQKMKEGKIASVLIMVALVGLFMVVNSIAGATMDSTTIHTQDANDTVYSGVSAMTGDRIVVSLYKPGLGRSLRILDVSTMGVEQVGGSLIVPTGLDFLDVAHVGQAGGDEVFYISRDSVQDIFAYQWNPTTYVGTYIGVQNKYNSSATFQGIDMEFGGEVDEADSLVVCTTTYVYRVDASGDPAVLSNIGYTLVGSSDFSGVTAIGDLDNDGVNDYVTCRNSQEVSDPEAKGRLNVWLSTTPGSLQSGLIRDDRTYTGVASLGDPDGDGFVELIVVGRRRDNGNGTIEYIQTDIAAEPVCGDVAHGYPVGDLDLDCRVNLIDFSMLAGNWLDDTNP